MKSIANTYLKNKIDNKLSVKHNIKENLVSNRVLNKKLTSKRRKSMLVKVIEINITNNHLSQDKKLYLKKSNKLYKNLIAMNLFLFIIHSILSFLKQI